MTESEIKIKEQQNKSLYNRKRSKDDSIFVTDEIINTSTHLSATIFAILGTVLLIVKSSSTSTDYVWRVVSFAIYGASLIFQFLASSLHHGINSKRKIEEIFRLFDYFAIFPLIAGTFTPICLVTLRTKTVVGWPIGWALFGTIWGLAAFGIAIKAVFPKIPKWVTNTIYLSMGWIGIILAIPFYLESGIWPVTLLTIGGVFYTVGSFIFYKEWPNPIEGKFGFHEIWHIFVILGAVSHFFIMYLYI